MNTRKVEELINSAESVCLMIDLWSNRQMRLYIGITWHMVIDYRLESVVLVCKLIKGRHTTENIVHHYEDFLSAYDIGSKIASNMVKGFDLPGFDKSAARGDSLESSSGDSSDVIMEYIPEHERCSVHSLHKFTWSWRMVYRWQHAAPKPSANPLPSSTMSGNRQ